MAEIACAVEQPTWDAERFQQELALPQSRAFVAEKESVVAGFAIGWEVIDELELHLIAVDAAHRRQGLGTALLDTFEAGAPVVYLEVAESNAGALALYRGRGYREVGRRAHYYGRDAAALLMRSIRR